MIRFKGLRQKYFAFILFPVAILIFGMGYAGFTYARKQLLAQWGEATILKLQRAAHHIDMRLSKPRDMIKLFHQSAGMPHAMNVQNLILEQLRALEWVTRVDLIWTKNNLDTGNELNIHHHLQLKKNAEQDVIKMETVEIMQFHRGDIIRITPPKFDATLGGKTVILSSTLLDANDKSVGILEVEIIFRNLIDTVRATGWWQEHKAFLVDEDGVILSSNTEKKRKKLGENNNAIERSTLYAMKSVPFGTIFGKESPPKEISGFYKLEKAPWMLVLIVPAKDILSAIIRFRISFFAVSFVFVLLILFVIRFVTGRTVSSIKDVSMAAQKVAEGDYEVLLPAKTNDEVGELIHSFDTMVLQLKEGAHLKYNLNLAKEVQQNLLPGESLNFKSLDIAGKSISCDETGGDYYDFMHFPEIDDEKLGVVVGDVSGHGVASALFVTTARAMIRSRMIQPGSPAGIITAVNQLLCLDTVESSNFITLFFLVIDNAQKEIKWVRAGHDPAILYDVAKDKFIELGGEGMAMGIDENWTYKEYVKTDWNYEHIILIGTDGIWETTNQHGEQFGKKRLREILKRQSHDSASNIIKNIIEALANFRQNAIQEDDITVVVIKTAS
jgi:sigma-B regulation protein RsbU (phosphoserine phosphatase)